eukprot:scaffold325090_cov78-Attheya_sp.AAC.2
MWIGTYPHWELKAKIVSTRRRDYNMDAAAIAADAIAAAANAGAPCANLVAVLPGPPNPILPPAP